MTETNDGQVTVVAAAITNGKQVLAAKRDQDYDQAQTRVLTAFFLSE